MTSAGSHLILFNDTRYQGGNLRCGQHLFRYDHIDGRRIIGTLSGVVEDGLLDCGHSAPFGGIDLARRRESVGNIINLLRAALSAARDQGVREVRVRARPGYFGVNETAVEFALLNLGATIESCEISQGLEVWRFRTAQQYMATLDGKSRNKLRQSSRAGLGFGQVQSAAEWRACYDLLADTKKRRGVILKISLDYLLRLRELFGERIAMHRLSADDELSGAALVYRVRRDWDYVVAWGDDLAHRSKRVMNAMAYHLVAAAIARGVKIVDLGISSVNGTADEGLMNFKRSIGGTIGLRRDFRLAVPRP